MHTELLQFRFLIIRMTIRDIALRYRGSILGVIWSFILPLLTVAIYTFLFSYVFKARWSEQGDGLSSYPLILFTGLILHSFLSEVLTRSCTVIRVQSNLVKKVVFPLHVLPAVLVLSGSFQMIVSFCVLFAFQVMMFGHLSAGVLVVPLLFICLVFMGLGAAWFLAALGVYLQDLAQVIGLISTALMFSAPILYPINALPEFVRPWLYLNPLTFLVEQLRNVLLFGGVIDWLGLFIYAVAAVFVVIFGWWVFDRTKKGFADVL